MANQPATRMYSLEEVARHNKDGDCWVVIDNQVYDVSKFLKLHPGGRQVLLKYSGQDASDLFHVYHNKSVLAKFGPKFHIGIVQQPKTTTPTTTTTTTTSTTTFGDLVPYGDPVWYQRFNTPYYKDTHRRWRAKLRQFVDTEIIPTLEEWKNDPQPPAQLVEKMGNAGIFASMCGENEWPARFLPSHVNKEAPQDYDLFHELITYDEISRCGLSSVIAALTNGPAIGLPVILRFGSDEMKQRVVPDVLLGRKFIALAISEPGAGSDVASMQTTAVLDGDHYIVNGNKKWITNGSYSHYFVTSVVTGGPGQLSFLLVEKDTPGFSVRKLDLYRSNISGTAYLDFDQCRVPVSNLIGKPNHGFKLVMYNFNHERMYISAIMARLSRICLEESIRYALKRQVFSKRLADLQSIRMKIAAMARNIEQYQAWLDFVVYQLCTMNHQDANEKVGDVISLLKAQGSKVYEFCARETTMIFGGNALYGKGVGQKIEPAVNQVKGYQIPAGAEDVMDDYAARAAFRRAIRQAKL